MYIFQFMFRSSCRFSVNKVNFLNCNLFAYCLPYSHIRSLKSAMKSVNSSVMEISNFQFPLAYWKTDRFITTGDNYLNILKNKSDNLNQNTIVNL